MAHQRTIQKINHSSAHFSWIHKLTVNDGRSLSEKIFLCVDLTKTSFKTFPLIFLCVIVMSLFASHTMAQICLVRKYNPIRIDSKRIKKEAPSITNKATVQVQGKIIDESGHPVAFATVMIWGTKKGISADSAGRFDIKLSAMVNFLWISAIGYRPTLFQLNHTLLKTPLEISLQRSDTMMPIVISSLGRSRTCRTGGCGGHRITICRIHLHNTLIDTSLKNTSISLFPNPAKKNSAITIQWKKPVSQPQLLMIYNTAGIKMFETTLSIKHHTKQTTLNPGLQAAGNYYMVLIDRISLRREVVGFVLY